MERSFHLQDVRIRDACILPDAATQTYYLCTSIRPSEGGSRPGVGVYTSQDLIEWRGPHIAFEVPADFWGQEGIWAPELHAYRGRYYLFLTINTQDPIAEPQPGWLPFVKRGSQVLVGDAPRGPFRPFRNRAHLPVEWMTLDGTLWVEDGVPYMVYCHEWVQIKDGTVEVVRLTDDLSDIVGEPTVLFHGSDAPWGTGSRTYPGSYVTDGPFLYRTRTGTLLMVWSSFISGAYATGVAVSETGKLHGPWRQEPEPLFAEDGGHAMIFRRFDGGLMLVLHQPNQPPNERARLFELEDTGDSIRIARAWTDG